MIGDDLTSQFGVQALLYMIVNLFFVVVTWWALQSFRFDVFLKNPESPRSKVLMLLITIVIGSAVGSFFFNYLYQSLRLPYLF